MDGKTLLTIGAKEILDGLASSDYAANGGFGVSSSNLNPFPTEGILQATQDPTDKSTNLSGNLIASCEDSQVVSPANRVLIDASGNVYDSSSVGGLTKRITSAAKTYSFGVTDMVSYAGSTYATSTTHMAKINTSAWTWTEDSAVFASSSVHHPLLVYEQRLYAGDGNLLKYTTDGVNFSTILTLASTERIVALGIDPSTGQMLISTQVSYNPTDSVQQKGIVYLYDGNSEKPTRKIIVEEMVTAFVPHGGLVHVGMGQIWGYWTGTGVALPRQAA
ncbi:hypothetical protein [uncultured Reyranella sp.]|uniref:hypothetical protein n=1 Tax=uncultured Reyranella sp. TaxID=735512 RepID=UPI0025D5B337|nr:hypothetical protein [uncultured Reyranella sp.]